MFKKIVNLLYDTTFGVFEEFQNKSLELVRFVVATYYLQGMRKVRQYCLWLFGVFFSAGVLAVTVVMVPITLVAISPWPYTVKAASIAAIGFLFALVPLGLIRTLFSEKHWVRLTVFEDAADKFRRAREEKHKRD